MTAWTVPATVQRVIDGDTIVVEADLGWWVRIVSSVRIDGINAHEISTPDGKAAADFLTAQLPAGTTGTLVSKKLLGGLDKYGRVLADFTTDAGVSVAQLQLTSGHAKPWDGKGAKP